MRRTATTANAILGLLALRPEWSTWDLTKQLRRNMHFFWPRAESQIYEEAKGLVTKGLARARQSYTGRRPRTDYAISAAGRRQLQRWLSTPPRATNLECEPLLRVFLGTLDRSDELLAAIAQIREDGQAILDVGRLVAAEYLDGVAPFQDQVVVRALVFDFLSEHARMLVEWADRAEAIVREWPRQTERARQRAALDIIRQTLAGYPSVPV